mgnify:CR=1 FL=1
MQVSAYAMETWEIYWFSKRYAEIFDDKQVRSICDSRFEQILEFLNEENILPTELYNPGFMTGYQESLMLC